MTQHPAPLIHPDADPFLAAIAASLAVDVLADPRWVESPCGPVPADGGQR